MTERRCEVSGCKNQYRARGFCAWHWELAMRDGRISKLTREDRFWRRVDKSGDCWTWTGCVSEAGYGYVMGTTAHRMSWRLTKGRIPHRLCVLHRCDNPPCVNPAHLFLGTKGDNNDDRDSKGRGGNKRGAANGNAILGDDDVRAIRALYAAGGISQARVARRFGVHQATVSEIVRFVKWRHVV